jgi:hypothetical protein
MQLSQMLPFRPVKSIVTSLSALSQKEHFLSCCFAIEVMYWFGGKVTAVPSYVYL